MNIYTYITYVYVDEYIYIYICAFIYIDIYVHIYNDRFYSLNQILHRG